MKAISNLTFPNFGHLRALVDERLALSPEEEITNREWDWVKTQIQQQMTLEMQHDANKRNDDVDTFPWAVRMCGDIAPGVAGRVNKWDIFTQWLDPDEGVCLKVPLLVSGIIRNALSA